MQLSDGSTPREFNQQINGEHSYRCGLCHDTNGRIYVAARDGVRTIDSRTGESLQHLIQNVEYSRDVCWTSLQPQKTVLHEDAAKEVG